MEERIDTAILRARSRTQRNGETSADLLHGMYSALGRDLSFYLCWPQVSPSRRPIQLNRIVLEVTLRCVRAAFAHAGENDGNDFVNATRNAVRRSRHRG